MHDQDEFPLTEDKNQKVTLPKVSSKNKKEDILSA